MAIINAQDISVQERQKYLTGGVGPRPIALVSTLSKDGVPNLAPFSFFNAFGANPPTLAFSPARRGRDGTLKDTYFNARDTKECAIAMCSYDMVEQISLASSEYSEEVNEFIKSGLTPDPSSQIKPDGVKESPIWFECKVNDIIHTGEDNGAGNIIICEILVFHINDSILENGQIHPDKADIVGRFGGNDYVRASYDSIFTVAKPTSKGMGFDNLPAHIKESHILSANNLARLANLEYLPDDAAISSYFDAVNEINASESEFYRALRTEDISTLLGMVKSSKTNHAPQLNEFKEKTAKLQIEQGDPESAWKTLLY